MTNWDKRYQTNNTGWDIGHISTPIKEYIDQLNNKNISILIPGAGNSYEAEYLHLNGFTNVTIVDISKYPLDNFAKRVPSFPKEKLIHQDFFKLNQKFDLIIEQTFFCAINPSLRDNYVSKMKDILNKNGKLIGLYFQFKLEQTKPPYGGSKDEYIQRFSLNFNIKTLENCYNSIKPRETKELFAIFEKK